VKRIKMPNYYTPSPDVDMVETTPNTGWVDSMDYDETVELLKQCEPFLEEAMLLLSEKHKMYEGYERRQKRVANEINDLKALIEAVRRGIEA
jgi:hypothetical protein